MPPILGELVSMDDIADRFAGMRFVIMSSGDCLGDELEAGAVSGAHSFLLHLLGQPIHLLLLDLVRELLLRIENLGK